MDTPFHRRLTVLCRVVLVLLAGYHVLTGTLAVCLPETSRPFYEALYHFEPHYWEQYELILKPWGSYAIFTGVVLAFAAWDPRRYRGVIWAMIGLLTIRALYRVTYAEAAERIFSIDGPRNALNVGLIVLWISVLLTWSVLDARVRVAVGQVDPAPTPEGVAA